MLFYVFSPKMEITELNIIISSTLKIDKFNRVFFPLDGQFLVWQY